MEDLVATVEDARYVNAVVQDDKPQAPWKFPSEEELAEWKAKKEKDDPKYLEEATIKETISGKYLVEQYYNPTATPGGTTPPEKAPTFLESTEFQRYMHFSYIREKPVSEVDFLEFRVLGKGGFGQVKGVRKMTTGNLYALKTQLKKKVKEGKAEKLVKAEWGALQCVESEFIVKLHYAYHNEDALFLVLEIATGGDLNYALKKERPMKPERSKYYGACILAGLGHLHKAGFVYRDLKPENILLTKDGRCKMSDLGLACQFSATKKLKGVAGTRGYWAPEMLLKDESGSRVGYDEKVDWWSFGCYMFETTAGCNPFRSKLAEKMDEDVKVALDKATLELDIEQFFDQEALKKDPEAADLLRGLLNRNPEERLGAKGVQEIKDHKYFSSIDFEVLHTMTPPFVPSSSEVNAKSQLEIDEFNVSKSTKLTDEDKKQWDNWDFTNRELYEEEVVTYLKWEKEKGPLPQKSKSSMCNVL